MKKSLDEWQSENMLGKLNKLLLLKSLDNLGYCVPSKYTLTQDEKKNIINNKFKYLDYLKIFKILKTENKYNVTINSNLYWKYEEYRTGLEKILEKLKILKFLREHKVDINGFNFGSVNYGEDMKYDHLCTIEGKYLEEICGEITITPVTNDVAEAKGYVNPFEDYDPDEMTLVEYEINHPQIKEYLNYCDKNNIQDEKFDTLVQFLIQVDNRNYDDYAYHESFITKDRKSILFLVSDVDYLDLEFLERWYFLVDYCKEALALINAA